MCVCVCVLESEFWACFYCSVKAAWLKAQRDIGVLPPRNVNGMTLWNIVNDLEQWLWFWVFTFFDNLVLFIYVGDFWGNFYPDVKLHNLVFYLKVKGR